MKTTNKAVLSFLVNRDETGKFLVKSPRTGKVYFIEPIHNGNIIKWGDIDPVTKKLRGSYGKKYTGAVTEKESVITTANGFSKIVLVKGSPFYEIELRDQAYLNA